VIRRGNRPIDERDGRADYPVYTPLLGSIRR